MFPYSPPFRVGLLDLKSSPLLLPPSSSSFLQYPSMAHLRYTRPLKLQSGSMAHLRYTRPLKLQSGSMAHLRYTRPLKLQSGSMTHLRYTRPLDRQYPPVAHLFQVKVKQHFLHEKGREQTLRRETWSTLLQITLRVFFMSPKHGNHKNKH